jgi:D-alanyl-lipoteichoic acid acyltransferase DltB (MBOAT superfamily)
MPFNSIKFFIFLPIAVVFFYLFPPRFRWVALFFTSAYFYFAYKAAYLLLLIFYVFANYVFGIWINKEAAERRKMAILVIGVTVNLGLLAYFKYAATFTGITSVFGGVVSDYSLSNVIFPLGISFFTFSAIGYLIEIYRGTHAAERHLGIFSLFIMFFPKMIAGPIERSQHLIYQFHEHNRLAVSSFRAGIPLILWGLFKKVVIADRLALFVDPVFATPQNYSSLSLLIAVFLFPFQIFSDFSGYTDIAIGSARLFGFKLTDNFNRPFVSLSISEYWRRWHISLSTWLHDYLYSPLVLKLRDWGNYGIVLSLMVTFILCGFWHGAN